MLRINWYRIKILYKPRPYLFIAEWMSLQNYPEDKDGKMPGMKISIDAVHTAVNITESMSMQDIQQAML